MGEKEKRKEENEKQQDEKNNEEGKENKEAYKENEENDDDDVAGYDAIVRKWSTFNGFDHGNDDPYLPNGEVKNGVSGRKTWHAVYNEAKVLINSAKEKVGTMGMNVESKEGNLSREIKKHEKQEMSTRRVRRGSSPELRYWQTSHPLQQLRTKVAAVVNNNNNNRKLEEEEKVLQGMEALCFRRSQPPVIQQAEDDVQVEEEEEAEEGVEEKMIDVEPKNGLKVWMKRGSGAVKTVTEMRGELDQREFKSDDSDRGSLTEVPRQLHGGNGSPSHAVVALQTSFSSPVLPAFHGDTKRDLRRFTEGPGEAVAG